jgi:hypothetical protein
VGSGYVYRGTGADTLRQPRAQKPAAHGTRAGFQAHKLHGERPCTPCNEANNAYFQAYRNRGRCAPGLGWPLLPGTASRG